MNMKVKCNKNK